jgi:hypothetical protein
MTYEYDYRPIEGQMYDQGQLGSCAENMFMANINIIDHQLGLPDLNGSRLQTYYDFRAIYGGANITTDTGTDITMMLKNAQTIGVAPETDDPYIISTFTQKPSAQTYTDAAQHKVLTFYHEQEPAAHNWVTIRDMMRGWLDEGKMPEIGFTCKSWYPSEHGTIGTIDPANAQGTGGSILGGHAGLVVGMDDSLCGGRGGYIVQNSWGTSYGDNGNMVIPYDEFPGGSYAYGGYTVNINTLDVITGWQEGSKVFDLTWTDAKKAVSNLYVGEMGRAADIDGLTYWAGRYSDTTNPMTLKQIAQSISVSGEYNAMYAGLDVSAKIDQIYVNSFGHHADSTGLAYWAAQFNNGTGIGEIIVDIQTGAIGNDLIALGNKQDMAMYASVTDQLNNLTELQKAMGFNALSHDALQAMKITITNDMHNFAPTIVPATSLVTGNFSHDGHQDVQIVGVSDVHLLTGNHTA